MTDEKTNRAKGRLKLSNLKLNTLLEITDAINSNSSKAELFGILEHVLLKELHIGKFALFSYDKKWKVALTSGVKSKQAKSVDFEHIIDNYNQIDVLNSTEDSNLKEFDIVIPVFHKNKPLAFLLLADFDGEKIEISPIIKHLKFIQTLANIVVVALENKRLNKEYIKQVEVKKELELAQKMQTLLFPRNLPNTNKLVVKSFYKPHNEVGGDYYDVIQLDDSRTVLCIADVSGKGFPAALLMANFQANLRALLTVECDLKKLIEECNQKVIESANYEKFITLFIAVYNADKKEIEYLNAGHQPALLINNNHALELKKGCTVLGMFDTLPSIEIERIKISGNDKLLCFTDGLTELENDGEQIGVEGLIQRIEHQNSIEEIMHQIESLAVEIKKSSSIEDDITLLGAEFLP